MRRGALLRAVLREFERGDTCDLWSYLLAFNEACEILGGRLPGPIGRKGHHERCVGLCLAAAIVHPKIT